MLQFPQVCPIATTAVRSSISAGVQYLINGVKNLFDYPPLFQCYWAAKINRYPRRRRGRYV